MRVYRYEFEEGEVTVQHPHTRPYLLVAATKMELRMGSPDGSSMQNVSRCEKCTG